MHQENRKYKQITPQRLRFPTSLKFKVAGNGLLECKGKSVQVIPSLPIESSDEVPTDLPIFGIGKHEFEVKDTAIVIILSFVNSQTQKTDCAIIERDELVNRLQPCNYNGDEIKINLVLSKRGLHEGTDIGAEGWFMAIWLSESRNFTEYHNNWSVFDN